MPYKTKQEFLACLKKVIQRNGKNSNFCVSWTTLVNQKIKICLQIFFWKMFVWVQISI